MFANLRHKSTDFPFYPLSPDFDDTGVANWWRPRLRELRAESGLSCAELAQKIFVIEWFPYHSKKSALPTRSPLCWSQEYSFALATRMKQEGRTVLRMRSRKHWAASNPELDSIDCLKNPQSGYVTRNNTTPALFEKMLGALKS
jgi:hypothetical protein